MHTDDKKAAMRLLSVSICVYLRLIFCVSSAAFAQTTKPATHWTLTTADFQSRQVDLVSISADGANVKDDTAAPARVIGLDQLLALDRVAESADAAPPASKAGPFILHLASGDQIRGEPKQIA